MGLDYQRIIDANENQFKYIVAEKYKLIKKITATKYSLIFVIFIYTAFRIFPQFLEDYSFYKSLLIAAIIIFGFGFVLILSKNEMFLSSNNIKKLNVGFKNTLILYLIKSISDQLSFNPINRISERKIRESGLFHHNSSEIKGGNLIKGEFDEYAIQASEIVLFKGGSKKFQGVFFYVKGINQNQIISEELDKLSNTWRHRGNELYIAISRKREQFHIALAESNRSIEHVKKDFAELVSAFQVISKMTGIKFESSFIAPPQEKDAFEGIFGKKSVYTNPELNRDFTLADSTKRALNYLIDQIVILLLTVSVLFIFRVSNLAISLFFILGIYLCYYFILEYFFSQTVGKIVTKSKVVTLNGSRPGLGQVCLRTICRFIPFEQYSFIDSNIGLHDRLSKTIVVES